MPSVINKEDSLQTKVVKQLEYYFSDFNLRNDYFIKKLSQKDSGWLSVETLMKFNRLKSMVNNDKNILIQFLATLRSDLIECHPSGGKVRRRVDKPVPKMDDQMKQSFEERSVEVKGFPKDMTLDELIQWSQQFGAVLSIQMKRLKPNPVFNGCAVITFAEKSMADKVVNQSVLKFKDLELTKETKWTQTERKRELLASKTAKKKTGLLIQKMQTISVATTEQKEAANDINGTVLQLKGMPRRLVAKEKKKKSNRIKDFFNGYGKVVYVSSDSSGNCLIQFASRSMAQKVLDLNKAIVDDKECHKLIFNGKEVSARLLTTDEELGFWLRANRRKDKKIQMKDKKKVNKLVEDNHLLRKRSNTSLTGQEPKRLTPATA